ncbi:MAG: ABC transporter ATP-binding protein [Chloroflexi bacterium]|nr:ABC transporter ATP-binding protein [Chloroflexota bacterium]
MTPTLSIQNLTIEYAVRRGAVQAVRNISFDIRRGEVLSLIGESGSGKTTFGLGVMRLLPTMARVRQGSLLYRRDAASDALEVLKLNDAALRAFRWKHVAMVFQSALNSFNPVLRISDQFADTAHAHGYLRGNLLAARAAQLFTLVRLDPERVWRAFPHELSGGMRQRVMIALALLLEPQLLILDEPTTALDVLTQRNIIDVLKELRHKLNFALLFISHDLSLAADLADRVATMYAGKLVEIGDVFTIFQSPRHPYTTGLIRAVPTLTSDRKDLTSIPGSPPDLIDLPSGCKFHPRCPLASARCKSEEPELEDAAAGHQVACWNWRAI